jgi:predicted transport protein
LEVSPLPLFSLENRNKASQIHTTQFSKEKDIQKLCESNLETFFSIRFVATEFSTGAKHAGRVDTLGLDENGYPVIIEYKKTGSQSIISQGLYYLNWLNDHKGDYQVAAQQALGNEVEINWEAPRLILIAESFSKYDPYAAEDMGLNIELKTYRYYENDLIYFDNLYTPPSNLAISRPKKEAKKAEIAEQYELSYHLDGKSQGVSNLLQELREAITSLSDYGDVQETINKKYIAYKTTKNFCEIVVQAKGLKIYVDITKEEGLADPRAITEDCSTKGHWATGDTRFYLSPEDDIDYAMSLIKQAYNLTL